MFSRLSRSLKLKRRPPSALPDDMRFSSTDTFTPLYELDSVDTPMTIILDHHQQASLPRNSSLLPDDIHFMSADESTPLCELCSSMALADLRSPELFDHHQRGSLLIHGGPSKCPFCALIWDRLSSELQVELDSMRSTNIGTSTPSTEKDEVQRTLAMLEFNPLKLSLDFRTDRIQIRCYFDYHYQIYGFQRKLEPGIRISIDRKIPNANQFEYQKVSRTANHQDVIDLANSWSADCLLKHRECSENATAKLPTRVLDLGCKSEETDLYLFVPAEITGHSKSSDTRYVALSYCWGTIDSSFVTTTSANLHERKNKIAYSSLPKTIQDAIIITRKLGLRYLWVDALCILQGSDDFAKADWARESSRMAEVYGNSFLTIAAASGTNIHSGILVKRPDLYDLKLQLVSESRPDLNCVIYLGPEHRFINAKDEPLYTRGWTLQERILSPRVLIFNRDQLEWECQCHHVTESGYKTEPHSRMNKAGAQWSIDMNEDNATSGYSNIVADRWRRIVEDYLGRSLTNPGDKLPALSGLARAFATFHNGCGGTYLAGLWQHNISYGLMWYREFDDGDMKAKPSAATEYIAPSWSFMAVNGSVKWVDKHHRRFVTPHSQLLDFCIELSGDDPFGSVTGGSLTIRGRLQRLDRLVFESVIRQYTPRRAIAHNGHRFNTIKLQGVYLDFPLPLEEYTWKSETTKSSEFWILHYPTAYLIMELVPDKIINGLRVFKRIGITWSLNVTEGDIWRDCWVEDIVLI